MHLVALRRAEVVEERERLAPRRPCAVHLAAGRQRVATRGQVLHVRTHDVAIAGFGVPTRAKVGETARITVDISDTRYPETVQVTLSRSVGGNSFVAVGQLTQPVPSGTRTTRFSFDYTFTSDDAGLGKVTFEASAGIVGARDALPIDNGVSAPRPTDTCAVTAEPGGACRASPGG